MAEMPDGADYWLAAKLGLPALFSLGTTTPERRRELLRAEIVKRNLADVVVGRRNGKPETYGEFFQRIYDQPLTGEKPCSS